MKPDIVEALFEKFYNDALLYSLALCGNKSLAEEIVSSAFFKALKTADGAILDFKSWLLRVCRNTFYSYAKRNRRYVELNESIKDEREAAVDKLIRDENYQALYKAIGLLPDIQKEIVTLFYFENMPIKAIADIVEKKEDNVKVLLYRARENLKGILEVNK